jgi:hypothetical protein
VPYAVHVSRYASGLATTMILSVVTRDPQARSHAGERLASGRSRHVRLSSRPLHHCRGSLAEKCAYSVSRDSNGADGVCRAVGAIALRRQELHRLPRSSLCPAPARKKAARPGWLRAAPLTATLRTYRPAGVGAGRRRSSKVILSAYSRQTRRRPPRPGVA